MTNPEDRYFADAVASEGLAVSSARSGVAIFASRIVSIFVQFGTTVLLARLIDPRDFGLVAVVAALTLFAPIIVDFGTSDAVLRKKSVSRAEIDSLFWLNIAIGFLAMLLFAAASPLVAAGFGQPELRSLAFVWSLTFLLTAFSVQHFALMRRAMEFRTIAIVEIAANVVSSVIAIILALKGFEYWALVARALLAAGLQSAGAWIACAWRPGAPKFIGEARTLVSFGLGIVGFAMLDTASRSSDRIALGYFVGPTMLGYFHNANVLFANALAPLTEPMHGLAIAGLSKMRDDQAELKRAWAKALAMLSFWGAAAFAGLAVVAYELVVVLMGERWAYAGVLLSVLALRGIPNVVERTHGWLHVVLGHSGRWTRWGMIAAGAQLCSLAAGLPFGAMGVAVASTVSMFVLFVPSIVYSGRDIGVSVRDVLSAVGPQILGAVVAVAVGFLFKMYVGDALSNVARLVLSGLVVGGVYLVLVAGLFKVREPIELALRLLPKSPLSAR